MNGTYTAIPDNMNPTADKYLISGSDIIGIKTRNTATINVIIGRIMGTLYGLGIFGCVLLSAKIKFSLNIYHLPIQELTISNFT